MRGLAASDLYSLDNKHIHTQSRFTNALYVETQELYCTASVCRCMHEDCSLVFLSFQRSRQLFCRAAIPVKQLASASPHMGTLPAGLWLDTTIMQRALQADAATTADT